MKPIQVEGRNPVLEMLRRGITITQLFIDSHARLDKKLEEILALAAKKKAKIKFKQNSRNSRQIQGDRQKCRMSIKAADCFKV